MNAPAPRPARLTVASILVATTALAWLAVGMASAAGIAGAVGTASTADMTGMTATEPWSPPATLSNCPGVGAPQVVFPSDKPTHGTGPGAIVWGVARPCAGGAGMRVAAIGPMDIPGQPAVPRTAAGRSIVLDGPVAATAGPYGHIVIAAASATGSTKRQSELQLTEGPAGGPFAIPLATGSAAAAPFAFATAYLGDVALLSPGGAQQETMPTTATATPKVGGGPATDLRLRVQRHLANRFAAPTEVTTASGASLEALTVALDFRSDALAAWAQGGSIYARDLPASHMPHPVQRLGPGPAAGTRIAAVISDDNRAIVAWTVRRAGTTSVYVSQSQTGVRFGTPRLLERFPDPPDLPTYAGSPRIVRLSSESVMMAWTGAEAGHWAVRVAAIDLDGIHTADTISSPGSVALLAYLAPGPDDEVLALWTEPQPTATGLALDRQAIFAARGFETYQGKTSFAAGEQVAPPGPNSEATVAFNPDSDRAVAAWRTGSGAIAYAIRGAG